MRGARRLRQSNKERILEECFHQMADAESCNWTIKNKNFFPKCVKANVIELSISQHLLYRVSGKLFSQMLLFQFGHLRRQPPGRIIAVMPREMRANLEKNELMINNFLSSICWMIFIILMWLYGCKTIFNQLKFEQIKNKSKYPNNIFITGISKNNLPHKVIQTNQSYNLGSWVEKNILKANQLILHNIKDTTTSKTYCYVDNPLPKFLSFRAFFNFLNWSIGASMYSFYRMFFGEWQYSFFLGEAALAKKVSLTPQNCLCRTYIFTTSNMLLKPLWTEVFEARKGKVEMLLYSTNIEGFKKKNNKKTPYAYFRKMNWKNITGWDEKQRIYLENAIENKINFSVKGPIWFSDANARVPDTEKISIAYFDVAPKRKAWIEQLTPFYYYNRKLSISALKSVLNIADKFSFVIYLKQKRQIHKVDDRGYINFLDKLNSSSNIIKLNPELAAHHVVKKADLIISLPWTSPSVIGKFLEKPSCYFDPLNMLDPNDPASHGVKLIQSEIDLENWIRKNLKKTN